MSEAQPHAGIKRRRASRLILLDREGRVLLLRHAGTNGAFWAPPGGGLEANETFEQAASREASEELGLNGFPVRFLWERTTDFLYIDGPVRQHEQFFLLEARLPILSSNLRETHEREGILEVRWWTTAEIESTSERIFPEEITSKLREISQ